MTSGVCKIQVGSSSTRALKYNKYIQLLAIGVRSVLPSREPDMLMKLTLDGLAATTDEVTNEPFKLGVM